MGSEEINIGDYVQVISQSMVPYTCRYNACTCRYNSCGVFKSAIGLVTKVTRVAFNNVYFLDDLPDECHEIYNRHNLKKVDPIKVIDELKWQLDANKKLIELQFNTIDKFMNNNLGAQS